MTDDTKVGHVIHGIEAYFAEKSKRDGRGLSALGLLGLAVGIAFLAFTVLIGMVDALKHSQFFQDLTIQRIIFCIAIGLILASLGDYAFFGVQKLFAIGGAGAIALGLYYVVSHQPNENTLSAQLRIKDPEKPFTAVYLRAEGREISGQLDETKKTATFYNFSFPVSFGEKLWRECFVISMHIDKNTKEFEINGHEARIPHTVRNVFDLIYDGRANSITHRSLDGIYHPVPKCPEGAPGAPAEVLPTRLETTAAQPASQSTSVKKKGWTYYGALNKDNSWKERMYDNKSRPPASQPQSGDEAEVTDEVYMRKGPKKCEASGQCEERLPEIDGVLQVGQRVSIGNVVQAKDVRRSDTVWVEVTVK
jgi:hypothetical protein